MMYFPKNMTFQYFFFDTYVGYFLQALLISLFLSAIYGAIIFRTDKETPAIRKLFACIFVCYFMGLLCLVVGLDMMNIFWYRLIYHMDPGKEIYWFSGCFNFVTDFYSNINAETIGNFLMFLPFGILYPLSQKDPVWKRCVLSGLATVAAIEFLQPVFGRAFDMNDIILNSLGIIVSTSVFMGVKKMIKNRGMKLL